MSNKKILFLMFTTETIPYIILICVCLYLNKLIPTDWDCFTYYRRNGNFNYIYGLKELISLFLFLLIFVILYVVVPVLMKKIIKEE